MIGESPDVHPLTIAATARYGQASPSAIQGGGGKPGEIRLIVEAAEGLALTRAQRMVILLNRFWPIGLPGSHEIEAVRLMSRDAV